MAGIGEHHRDAAAHAAGAEAGDGGSGAHRQSPRAAAPAARRDRARRGRALASVRPRPHEILAADRAADGEKRTRQRRRHAGQFAARKPGTTARCARPPACSDARVSTMCSRQSPRIGQLVVRAAAVHPFLALAGVVVGERKMRRAIAERLAHRDAFGIERIGDAADRRLACPPCGCPSARNARAGAAFMVISGGWMIGPAFISAPDSASPQSRSRRETRGRSRRAHDPSAAAETRRSAAAWRGW